MSLTNAIAIAATHHKGNFIYHTKQQCINVLEAVEAAKPEWYDDACGAFLHSVKAVPTFGTTADCVKPTSSTIGNARPHPIVVLEGLDGSGKTSAATELVKRLPATLVRTPNPRFETNVREKFRNLPEPISRAFYCAANYLAAEEVTTLRMQQPVLLDRWWGSTCSMALASRRAGSSGDAANSLVDRLPAGDSYVYKWPADLPLPTCGFVLDVDEEIRRKRAELRGDMKPEEHALAAKEDMRRAVKAAYRHMAMYTFVTDPTWPLAVNTMIDTLEGMAEIPKGSARRCTAEEIAAVKPY